MGITGAMAGLHSASKKDRGKHMLKMAVSKTRPERKSPGGVTTTTQRNNNVMTPPPAANWRGTLSETTTAERKRRGGILHTMRGVAPFSHQAKRERLFDCDHVALSDDEETTPGVARPERTPPKPMPLTMTTFRSRKKVDQGPPGFYNIGNSCYLSATLQVMLNVSEFVNEIVRLSTCAISEESSLIRALYDVIEERRSASLLRTQHVTAVKQALEKHFPSVFAGSHQQDAHECFIRILDAIEKESTLAGEVYACPFSFSIMVSMACAECRHKTHMEEKGNVNIGLDLGEDPVSVEKLVSRFFMNERICKNCDACKAKDATHAVRRRIKTFPKALVLHLKRFVCTKTEMNRMVLSKSNVSVQPCLEMPSSVLPTASGTRPLSATTMQLSGIVHHHGPHIDSGHYIADIRGKENQYYRCNDASVEEKNNLLHDDGRTTMSVLLVLILVLCGDSVLGQSSMNFRVIPSTDNDASPGVTALTDMNFDRLVNGSSDWMVYLYSEWCPACQEMKPVWNRLGAKSLDHGYHVGKVDVNSEKVLLYRFQVTKLPTVLYISREYRTMYEYQGARTVNTMHHFAIKGWRQANPISGCSCPVSRGSSLYRSMQYFLARCVGDKEKSTLVMRGACALLVQRTRRYLSRSITSDHFTVIHQSTKSNARVGVLKTTHGDIMTPTFVPVATNGALKGIDFHMADAQGLLDLVFCNTYHLMLHPGADVIAEAGGLGAFTGRTHKPLFITDSGGFQVFSLAYGSVHDEIMSIKRKDNRSSTREGNKVVSISEHGVTFKSYRDGTDMLLTPETSVAAQKKIGADIILPLDELPPYHVGSDDALRESTERSHRWEDRSLQEHVKDPRGQAMWGIIHGGSNLDLRSESVRFVASRPFDGYAIGGSLGSNPSELYTIIKHVMQLVPRDKSCHVLGIADPKNIPILTQLGCDTFDSCYSTRCARHASMMTDNGMIKVRSGRYKSAHHPLEGCSCYTCSRYNLSYLHHLVKANEPIAQTLLSLHNISFMLTLMERLRRKILRNEL